MAILYISDGVFHGFQLVTIHQDLSCLVVIAVELAKSDYLACGHLKIAGRQLFFRVRNLNGRENGFADLYQFLILVTFVYAHIIR